MLQIRPGLTLLGVRHEPVQHYLIVAASLTLTAYFGAAAWRASDDRHSDITGSIAPAGDF